MNGTRGQRDLWLWGRLGLAREPPLAGGYTVQSGWVVAACGLTTRLELVDHAVYALTSHRVSGHSLKHDWSVSPPGQSSWPRSRQNQAAAARAAPLTKLIKTGVTHEY